MSRRDVENTNAAIGTYSFGVVKPRIAILLLNNNGDILYATPLSRQIKEIDFPGSTLTWIVSKQCATILNGNPYIDELEILELNDIYDIHRGSWPSILHQQQQKENDGFYHKLFVLQPIGKNLMNYRFSIRQMILSTYPRDLKVDVQPLVYLSSQEVSNVAKFVREKQIANYRNVVLFEFSPKSGQINMTTEDAVQIAKEVIAQNLSTCVILSSNLDFDPGVPGLFNASTLSLKENAELLNHCTLLLGCSSGISWLSTSSWCKPIPSIQILNTNVLWFNSLKADFQQNGLDSSRLLELYEFDQHKVIEVVTCAISEGWSIAKDKHNQRLRDEYCLINLKTIAGELSKNSIKNAYMFLARNMVRNVRFSIYFLKFARRLAISRLRD